MRTGNSSEGLNKAGFLNLQLPKFWKSGGFHTLENVVFVHLTGAGYNVTVGKLGTKEVDFVCDKQDRRIYVAYLIPDKKAMTGNSAIFWPYLTIIPSLLSMDEMPEGETYKGIEHVHIRRFLNQHPEY